MYHSGTGHEQIKNFMAVLEIEVLHHKTMKVRESEVEPHVLSVVKQSCDAALREEAQLLAEKPRSSEADNFGDSDLPMMLVDGSDSTLRSSDVSHRQQVDSATVHGEFKYDMGWQKRGSGRSYDSKSGVGTMIGNRTGKICAYGVRSKTCRKCSYHLSKGCTPPEHSCSKNWDGSSKAMEPEVAVQNVTDIESRGVKVGVMIMDDDCTTMAKMKQTVPHPVTKWSDLNHTRNHLGNSLYNLQKKHKCLSPKVIQFLKKCFSYAVAQNKDNAKGLEKSLQQIVPHIFGEHTDCESWCGYLNNPDTYKHNSLPYGCDLSGDELRKDLTAVFKVFIKNSSKIAPGGSTKDLESFNNMVATKARCHYSASKSLSNRLNCAVAQKNIGHSYITKVNKAIGVSPGYIASRYAKLKEMKHRRRLLFENTKEYKKQKLKKKLKNHSSNVQKELREGTTYKPAIATTDVADIREIPPSQICPVQENIPLSDDFQNVYCDIETTSLRKDCEILQIAAVCGSESFNQYVLPTQTISQGASTVTGLSHIGNVLFLNGNTIENALHLKEALSVFLAWLSDIGKCVLIGHNFRKFDFPRLIRAFDICDLLASLKTCVVGIIDTLPMYRNLYPQLEKHTQEFLLKYILIETYNAHNAIADVESLKKLVFVSSISKDKLFNHSVTTDSAISLYTYYLKGDANYSTLLVLQEEKVLSKEITMKMARSGLVFDHLKLAVSRSGFDGLFALLSEKVNGKPRVTVTKRIIEKLYGYLNMT